MCALTASFTRVFVLQQTITICARVPIVPIIEREPPVTWMCHAFSHGTFWPKVINGVVRPCIIRFTVPTLAEGKLEVKDRKSGEIAMRTESDILI